MAKLFWVEDQNHWIEKFQRVLESEQFDDAPTELMIYRSPDVAKQHIGVLPDENSPDVALLDAHMLGFDQAGFSVARALVKRWPDLPIIYLSELSGTDIEQEAIMETDARDFIAKHQPNIEQVLCWRIRATLKRQRSAKVDSDSQLSSGDLRIDLDTWEVFWKNKKLMNPLNAKRPLAPTPRKILKFLVERSPRPQTTEQIAELIEADIDKFSYASYRQHIKTLRMAFDAVEPQAGAFSQACKQGTGIVTSGESGAYSWKIKS
jgi:DNA-binding response OmpR family regulator